MSYRLKTNLNSIVKNPASSIQVTKSRLSNLANLQTYQYIK